MKEMNWYFVHLVLETSIVIATHMGQGIRFKENEVRAMGRQAAGVIGIRLKKMIL